MTSDEFGDIEQLDENLNKWFKEKWVRFGPDGKIRGACARGDDSEGKPKCLPQKKAQNLGKKGRKYAASKKRREDPNPERKGKAKNVATKKKTNEDIPFNECPSCRGPIVHESMLNEKQDACYHKVKSRYKVWPSAYASGALVQCRKKGASNWGNGKKTESSIMKGIVGEAKAKPYVKPFYENGKQVGWKSSDGYHVKYWQMFAKDSAIKHAKLNPAEVDEGIKDNIKKAALGLGTAAALAASPAQAKTTDVPNAPVAAQQAQQPAVFKEKLHTTSKAAKKYGLSDLYNDIFSPGQDEETLLKNIKKIHDGRPAELGEKVGSLELIPSDRNDADYIARVNYQNGRLDIYLQKGGMLKSVLVPSLNNVPTGKKKKYIMLWANWTVGTPQEKKPMDFEEDYTGEFAAEKTPKINPYGGLKDNQFRGAISETPTDNPTGASGEGGWRKYKPKPAGLEEGDVVPFKQNVEANHDEMNYSKDPKNRYYVIDHTMNKLVLTTNDEEEAKREAAEWAEYDDLETSVVDSTTGKRVIYFDGYGDAAEYLEDSDDDWIPDVEEFEQEEEIRNRKAKPANDIDEDTSYAGGMGQGGNAGQSYRKFKPKSAGTFKEDELDEACWKGYHKEGNKKMFGKTYPNCVKNTNEDLSQSDVDSIARFADKLYKKLGIDITFTKHFMDRVNDKRNGKPISGAELVRLFKKEYERWGKDVAQMGPDMEGTFKDLTTDINLPFVLRWDRDEEELDLVAKTVMRKKNFKTDNQEFPVDEGEEQLDEKCWDSHKQVGMKNKGGRQVPNCVPKESAIMKGLKSL